MTQSNPYRQTYRQNAAPCIICKQPLEMTISAKRKSGKPFVMFVCLQDKRHFRAFINDKQFVEEVMQFLEDGSVGS